MGLIHGIFFIGGQAFSNPDTIIPVFLSHFTDSKTLIGLSSTLLGSLGGIGSVPPQLFIDRRLENKIHKKPLLKFSVTMRALSRGCRALTTYIWGKSLPSHLRERFFGHRQLWGGILAIGSGLIAKIVLGSGRIAFPSNIFLNIILYARDAQEIEMWAEGPDYAHMSKEGT